VLHVDQLEAVAGDFRLRGVTLTAPSGSYGVLLGPPGSGKSVLVETICGLRTPAAGHVFIDDRDVTFDQPRDRRVGYVPQDYVLFPAKRVADNIIFGLRARGVGRRDALKQACWVLDLLDIHPLLDRWPATLSGGEQQRVALARALAIKPRVLLLDEPVSALDEGLRERVCRDLRRLQRELGITTIHVSHNLEEALAVSDWAAVLDDGALQQAGPMGDLLRRPANEMVARFLRAENVFAATARSSAGGRSILRFAGGEVPADGVHLGDVTFMVRPELVRVAPPGAEGGIRAELTDLSDRGFWQRLQFDVGVTITVLATADRLPEGLAVGGTYAVIFPPENVHVLDARADPG